MKKRDQALKTPLSSKLNTDNLIYKGLRNKVVQELQKSKVSHYTQIIESAKGQSTTLWKQLNNLTNKTQKQQTIKELQIDGKVIDDKGSLAYEFNTYFISSVDELAQNLNQYY